MSEWRDVSGYEGLYKVNDQGHIVGMKRGKILKVTYDRGGYGWYNLSKKCVQTYMSASRVVAIAFVPNPKNKEQVNHINGNTRDNRAINLEWCTPCENMRHAVKNKLHQGSRKVKM